MIELYKDLLELLNNKLTWHELLRKKPKRIDMIANIKVAYDMLYFETYGHRYFEQTPYKSQFHRQPKQIQNNEDQKPNKKSTITAS